MSERVEAGGAGMPLAGYAVDAGSLATGRFAWCRLSLDADAPSDEGRWPAELVAAVAGDLADGAVALGIEAPLWWPVPDSQHDLGKARDGDGNRPWSGGAGATITPTAVTQLAWILREVAEHEIVVRPTFDTERVIGQPRAGDLLLWEAFVSRRGHRDAHTRHSHNARAAAEEFTRRAHSLGQPGSFPSDVQPHGGDVLWWRLFGYGATALEPAGTCSDIRNELLLLTTAGELLAPLHACGGRKAVGVAPKRVSVPGCAVEARRSTRPVALILDWEERGRCRTAEERPLAETVAEVESVAEAGGHRRVDGDRETPPRSAGVGRPGGVTARAEPRGVVRLGWQRRRQPASTTSSVASWPASRCPGTAQYTV